MSGRAEYSIQLWLRSHSFLLTVVGVWLLALFVLFFQLRELPAESWADVVENQRLAQQVFGGKFFWNYKFGGDGPILPHLAGALGWLQGDVTFQTMKVTTALIGSTLPVAVMLIMTELLNHVVTVLNKPAATSGRWELALRHVLTDQHQLCVVWVGFISAVWFWPVVLSRQGKPYAVAMVMVAWLIWFVLKKHGGELGCFWHWVVLVKCQQLEPGYWWD